MRTPRLFEPIEFRGATARNRVMISPMQQYRCDDDGIAQDYHLAHLARFALGGAGIVLAEATAIDPRGRNTHNDLGLWSDEHVAPLARIAAVVESLGSVPGIQLVHAGRKGSIKAPWLRGRPLVADDAATGEPPWELWGPSPIAAGPDWPVPHEMSTSDIDETIAQWADAARRAVQAGFRIIDLHGAHGYLLHAFLSPLSNQRTDGYGGSIENRMRYPLEVVAAIRAAIPDDIALFYRLSVLDGVEGGWTTEDSIVFCRRLAESGTDLVDCSSGGATADRSSDSRVRRGFAFHAPYSRRISKEAGIPVSTVGLIVDPHQAEAILDAGDADVIAIAREALWNPNWAHHARHALHGEDYSEWNQEAGWWLGVRKRVLDRLAADGETPLSRYAGRPHARAGEAGAVKGVA